MEMVRWLSAHGYRREDKVDLWPTMLDAPGPRARFYEDRERDRFWRAFNATRERQRREAADARLADGLRRYHDKFYGEPARRQAEAARLEAQRQAQLAEIRQYHDEVKRVARERKLMDAWLKLNGVLV